MTMAEELSLHATPFADDFVDVAELNARISRHLLERIERVRLAAHAGENAASKAIAILGPAGGGKTHLFSRLSHQGGSRPTLVLLRPYFGVTVAIRDVLAAIIDQLCLPVHGADWTQLDAIASHWAMAEGIEAAVGAVILRLPEVAPVAHLVRALLELRGREPSAMWSDLAWLSGREPRVSADGAASALGEGDVLHVLRIVGVLAAPVAPIVLTFDQLENLAGDDHTRVLAYGNLVSEIVDSLPAFTIVQLALTSEWMQYIEPRLSLPQKTRLACETFVLESPDRNERELLLRTWHKRLMPMAEARRKARFPSPLSESELDQLLGAPGMTPRILLSALSRAISGQPMRLDGLDSPSSSVGSGMDALWKDEYERVRAEQRDKDRSNLTFDAAELAEAVTSALGFASHLAISHRTERDRVMTWVKAPGHELAIVYLTSTHHGSVAATLAKAAELARSTKVAVVREKRFEFPSTWETVQERRSAFERLPNARWLWIEGEDLARCLTLARLLSKSRAKKLHVAGYGDPLAPDLVREAVLRMQAPGEWASVSSITRWLSDIPRDSPAVVRETPLPSAAPVPAPACGPTPVSASPSALPPTLREWLAQGRALGRSTASRWVERVRALVDREED